MGVLTNGSDETNKGLLLFDSCEKDKLNYEFLETFITCALLHVY